MTARIIITACATIALVASVVAHALIADQQAVAMETAIMISECRILDAVAREDFAVAVADLTPEQRMAYIRILTDGCVWEEVAQ